MRGTHDAASHSVHDWQDHPTVGRLELSSKSVVRREGRRVSAMTHGDDFVVTEPTVRLTDMKCTRTGVFPMKKSAMGRREASKH